VLADRLVRCGREGADWRNLPPTLRDRASCHSGTFKITKEETGETLNNFNFRGGDLAVADWAYGTLNGIRIA
jgi:hypothetical protein